MISKKNTSDILGLVCGISSTMPILTIPRTNYSVFTAISIILLIYCIASNTDHGKVSIKKKSYQSGLQLWLVLALFSCLFGLLYYAQNNEWSSTVRGYIPKIVVFFLISLFLNYKATIGESLLKGIMYGAVINLIAATVDALVYYAFGFSIINRIFQSYITAHNIRFGMISLQRSGVIRSGGFNYDPAHIGMMAPMVFLYGICSKKYILVLLALGGILASLSTTALVCCFICFFVYMILFNQHSHFRITAKGIIISFAIILIFGFAIYKFKGLINIAYSNLMSRITNVYFENENGNLRLKYLVAAPKAMYQQGLKLLTGTGFMTASEGYIKAGDTLGFGLSNLHPYDMENTYLAYLFDLGIIGFFVYIMFLFRVAVGSKKALQAQYENTCYQMAFSGVLVVILSGLFYHYTLFACQILLFIAVSAILDQKNGDKVV